MRLDVGYGSVSFAGYGSAGGQPERRTMPKGPLPPCRAVGFACGAARFIEALAPWPLAQCGKLRGFGGRAPMTVLGMELVHLAGVRIGGAGHDGYECLSFLGGFAGVPANAACYPRVCLIAKRQVTDSGRGREKRSHLAVGRG